MWCAFAAVLFGASPPATKLIVERSDHIPGELVAHQLLGVARCTGAQPLIEYALRAGYSIDAERIDCPVRIVWGTADRLLKKKAIF